MDNTISEDYMDVETVLLPTDDGEVEYAILDYFDYLGKRYAITSPVEDNVIGESVEIFHYKENGETVTMDVVADKKQFNRIAEAYNNR